MRIGVTSESKIKVEAVRSVYFQLGIKAEITGYSTSSGVGEQPVEQETFQGARNRLFDLKNKVGGLDIIISIENGIFQEQGKWIDRAVVVIYQVGKEELSLEVSDGVEFPREYVDEARQRGFDKITVSQVMAERGYVQDAKDPHNSISKKPRREYLEETILKLIERLGN